VFPKSKWAFIIKLSKLRRNELMDQRDMEKAYYQEHSGVNGSKREGMEPTIHEKLEMVHEAVQALNDTVRKIEVDLLGTLPPLPTLESDHVKVDFATTRHGGMTQKLDDIMKVAREALDRANKTVVTLRGDY
jgi:hypothetical protein